MNMGDYDLRGLDMDQLFALNPLRDCCVDAANRATRSFDSHFPGWPLYARVVRGETYYDRTLRAWAITCARVLSRARQRNGHAYMKPSTRGPWIAVAAMDALDGSMGLRVPSASERAPQLQVRNVTYLRIYKPVAGLIRMGLLEYASELHYHLRRVLRDEREIMTGLESGGSLSIEIPKALAGGCHRTPMAQDVHGDGKRIPESLYSYALQPTTYYRPTAHPAPIRIQIPGTASADPDGHSAQPDVARDSVGT